MNKNTIVIKDVLNKNINDKEIIELDLSYNNFWYWLDENQEEIKDLTSLASKKENSVSKEEATNKVKNIFLGFQSFLISFLKNDLETITLRQAYDSIGYFLGKFLADNSNSFEYRDINICYDKVELINKIVNLNNEFNKNLYSGITMGNKINNISKEELFTSKSGIGNGKNINFI